MLLVKEKLSPMLFLSNKISNNMSRIFFLLCILTCHAYAAEQIGKVSNIKGDVFVIDANNSKRNLFKGDFLYTQDKIQTDVNSLVSLETINAHSFTLFQNTTLILSNYNYNKNSPELNTLNFDLISGTIKVNNSAASIKNTNLIQTPYLNIESTLADYLLQFTPPNMSIITINQGSARLLTKNLATTITQGQTFEVKEDNIPLLSSIIIPQIPSLDRLEKKAHISPNNISAKEGRPRLENYSNYKDFIQAMYLFKKAEEELKRPKIIIPNLPSGENLPEYSLIDDGYEVTNWAEDLTNLNKDYNIDNIQLVKQSSKMAIMTKDEMELSAVKDIFGVTFFSLADFLNMKVEELNRLISTKNTDDGAVEQQKSNDLMSKLLKDSIKTNAIGNDISIISVELGQPEITVIKRP